MQVDGELIPSSFLAGRNRFLRPANLNLLQVRDARQQRCRLLELPSEVLTEVLISLDWQDLLHSRQTCKSLLEVTMVKSIWVNLFNISNMFHSCSPLRLERPMERYIPQELEYLVLRRTCVEIIRKTRTQLSPALTRRFPIPYFDVTSINLIDGGRWLLTASGTGSVSYYDLDARQPVRTLLIQDQMEYLPDFKHVARMALDICNESTWLSFNLVLYSSRSAHRSTRTQIVQVWHVTLQLDQNDGASLSAVLLSSFHRENRGELRSISILGKSIAFGVSTPRQPETSCYVAIVDWAQADIHNRSRPRSLSYLRTIIYYRGVPHNVQLLPGDRVLIASRHIIEIHDMTSIGTTTSIPRVDFPLWPKYPSLVWELQMDRLRGDRLSQPYLCQQTNTLRFVLNKLNTVYGLIVQVDAHLGPDPELVMLMDFHVPEGVEVFLFGYNSAIVHGIRTSELHMLDYSWPGPDGMASPSNSLIVALDANHWAEMVLNSDFDEKSGRVVMVNYNQVEVFDFATL